MKVILPALLLAGFLLQPDPRAAFGDDAPAEEIREFPPRPAGPVDTSAEAIAREIRALGDNDFLVRDAASLHLFWIGEPARAALKQAAESSDAEVRLRAARTLALIDRYASLKEVDVRFMVRGYCLVGSKIEDKKALGGFGGSGNLPQALSSDIKARKGALQLIAQPDTVVVFGKSHKGMRLLVVNATDQTVTFDASDSRISIVQEATDEKGEWKSIEYLPHSW